MITRQGLSDMRNRGSESGPPSLKTRHGDPCTVRRLQSNFDIDDHRDRCGWQRNL